MLLVYDASGDVIGTLDWLVAFDADENPVGLVDFEANDPARVYEVPGAAGAAAWPEELGAAAHAFRVEVEGGRINALVHRVSGHRRERPTAGARVSVDAEGRTRRVR